MILRFVPPFRRRVAAGPRRRRGARACLLIAPALALFSAGSLGAQEYQAGPGGQIRQERPEDGAPHIHTLWESRYVSEGRDNLDGDGLLSVETELTVNGLTFAPWYAIGFDSDYEELNLSAIYAREFGFGEIYVAATHLHFIQDKSNDNEFGAGIAIDAPGGASVGVDGYHSVDAGGSFIEVSLSREFAVRERLTLIPRVVAGFNAGYIPDGHDGANHVQLIVEAVRPINDRLELSAFAGYNRAVGRDPENAPGDALLHDFFWGGIGVRLRF